MFYPVCSVLELTAITVANSLSHLIKANVFIFQRPYAEEHPFGDIILAGTEVDSNKEELTFSIHGGRDHARLTLRQALLLQYESVFY